ncbi:MAG: primosomal protein N', partial [Gammaproteobacteria bacterium]|nr:primosomal protein N' [Gammaproteobacteria bacterium]
RGYEAYARWQLEERVAAGLPPVGFQALLRAEAHQKQQVEQFLKEATTVFPAGATRVFGPMPAIMERLGGRSRMYLMLLSESRRDLHAQIDPWLPRLRALKTARKVRWSIDVDPQEL